MTRQLLVPVLLILAPGIPALAAATGPAQVLPPVEVVATPIVEDTTLSGFGFQTTLIGAAQIEGLNAGDLASAMRRTPGATIARYNPVGSFGGGEGGAVFLRGLGSSRPGGELKTTLEGVPVGNGVFNHPLLDLLTVDLSGGIEVSRRAEPLAAGNMFAGVNLKAPRVGALGSFFRGGVSAGSFGAWSERLEAGVRGSAGELYVGQSHREADGHRPFSDGRLDNVMLRGAWNPVPQLELSYLVHYTDNRARDPGAQVAGGPLVLPPPRGDIYLTRGWTHLAAAAWTRAAGGGSLKFYLSEVDADWFRRVTTGNADSLNDSRMTGVRWRESQSLWEGGEMVGGVDLDWTKGTTASVPPLPTPTLSFGPEKFRLWSAYGGVKHTMALGNGAKFTPSVGGRYYRHQLFGELWTPQIGAVLEAGAWRAHASANRAANFPGLEVAAFSTVAIPALGQTWRTLRPERLDQLEAGLRYAFTPAAALELTIFRNRARDRFVFVPPPPPPFRFVNVERFTTQGAELTASVRPSATLSLFAGVSRLSVSPADLPYAPRWSLAGGATWQIIPAVKLNVDASYVAEQRVAAQARAGGAPNLEQVPAFAVVNARLSYEFLRDTRRKAEVFIAVENLLDRDYRYRTGYPMPGAGVTFGVNGQF